MKHNLRIFMAACMTASLLPLNVYAAETLTVTPTDITADGVANYEGFGRITMYVANESSEPTGEWNVNVGWGTGEDTEDTVTYHGLVNRDLVVFPYSEGDYYVHNDVISYIPDEYDSIGNWNLEDAVSRQPHYYDLYGNRLFERFTLPDNLPEWLELSEFEASGYTLSDWGYTPFVNGYAKVVLNYYPNEVGGNLVAFIDKTGKVTHIADESFNSPNMSECQWLGWFGDNGWIAYFWPYSSYVGDSFFTERSAQAGGYLDAYGQKVLDISAMNFADAWPFAEGLSIVVDREGLKGAIDTNGNQVIPCLFMDLYSSSDGMLGAKASNGKWGYINQAHQTIIPFMYDDVYGWADGLGTVVLDGKCGLVDANNNIVLPLEYDDISSFKNGVCYAIKDRKLYIITR